MDLVSQLASHIWVLHLVCAGLYLCMAAYIVARGPKARLNWTCAAINACFFHWSLCLAVCHHPNTSLERAEFFYSVGSFAWASFASFAVLFIVTFLKSSVSRARWFWPALLIPPALVVNAQWSGWVAADYPMQAWGHGFAWQHSFWSYFFFTYYAIYMGVGLGLLLRSSMHSTHPVFGRQARIISSTAFIPLGLSSLTDVVLPYFDIHVVPNMAPDFTIIWVAGLVYAIAQYRMLELTPSGAADEIVSTVNEALLLVDPQGQIAWANVAAHDLFGREEYQLPKSSLTNLFPGLTPDAMEALTRRSGARMSLVARQSSGDDVHVLLSASSMTGTTGEPLGSVLAATDISELKAVEDRLRRAHDDLERRVVERTEELSQANAQMAHEVSERQKSEERYRLLIESMQEGLWVIDEKDRTSFVNARMTQILGFEASEMMGRAPTEFGLQGEQSEFVDGLAQARTGVQSGADWKLVGKAGDRMSAIVQIAPLIEDDEYAGAVLTVVDMTERERLQAQLVHADQMASLGLLAAGVGHEINNPLTYLLDNLRTLAEQLPAYEKRLPTDSEFAHVLQAVEESRLGAERVRDIVSDLRAFSRVDDDQMVPVEPNKVLATALSMAQNEIRFRAKLVKDYGEVPRVLGSEGRLSQVFLNLLVNAAHAIDEDSVDEQQIMVRTRRVGDEVLVEVRDTGSGIEPDLLGRLFEPFVTTKEVGKGFGLGLSICHQTVAAFGGRIEVESEVGVGSLFKVWLPVHQAELERTVPQVVSLDLTPLRGARVLVVDDEPVLRRVVKRALGRDCTVVDAESGEHAKRLLTRDQNFAVVFCDLMMPGMSGMELYEWLDRVHPEVAQKVVFMTGGVFTPRARGLLERATNSVLPKPFDADQVRRAAVDVISGSSSDS